VDVLPTGHNVQRVVWDISKKWWRSFGYHYELAGIRANDEKVLVYF
jgi:hypothetical protein